MLLWGGRWGSNPRPPGPQPDALPTELLPPYKQIITQILDALENLDPEFIQRLNDIKGIDNIYKDLR